ncbi:MAG: type II toxin-antitoxin system HicA family toxin [Candidatus Magasanikbacteria bacterium]|nr:type II toxin-antitoxin system HicA family toxin [Candidatus Magasanikbacteria bacterium]
MPPLPIITAKECIRGLEKAGFVFSRQKGSHYMMKDNREHMVVIPIHGRKEIPRGTLNGIIDDAGMEVEEFIELLK